MAKIKIKTKYLWGIAMILVPLIGVDTPKIVRKFITN
jgi:hypothetical protein